MKLIRTIGIFSAGFIVARLPSTVKTAIGEVFTDILEAGLYGQPRDKYKGEDFVPYNRRSKRQTKRYSATGVEPIVLPTQEEANAVMDGIFARISSHGVASVGDLYRLSGIPDSYIADQWGWTSLDDAYISTGRVSDGYRVYIPSPSRIDESKVADENSSESKEQK